MGNAINTDWDIAAPTDTDVRSDGAREIRVLRDAVGIRLSKEHAPLAADTGADPPDGGGEHIAGTAFVYINNYTADGEPTLRPDGLTQLSEEDVGRLWIDFDSDPSRIQYKLFIWTWDTISGSWVPAISDAGSLIPDAYAQFTGITAQDTPSDPITVDFEPRHVTIYTSSIGDQIGHAADFIIQAGLTTTPTLLYARMAFGDTGKRYFELSAAVNSADSTKYDLILQYLGNNKSIFNVVWDTHIVGTNP